MKKRDHHKVTKSTKGHGSCANGKRPVILFRQINGNKPCNWIDGLHWYVEYHAAHFDMSFPLGFAFVTVPPERLKIPPNIDFIMVADQWRRKGVATALVRACRERWPDIWLTDAISESGDAFLCSLGFLGDSPCPSCLGGESPEASE